MSTLLTALFYLWLVITILLIALWFLRRSDLNRQADRLAGGVPPTDRMTDPPITKPSDGTTVGSAPEPAGEPAPEAAAEAVAPPTVLDLLDGATLPYDLTPLTTTIVDHDRHAIFLSTEGDAELVGTAFADELVRLGYEIEPKGHDEALARRGEDILSLRISPDAQSVDDGGEPRYPTAAEGAVAIEVWTSNGPPPPLTR